MFVMAFFNSSLIFILVFILKEAKGNCLKSKLSEDCYICNSTRFSVNGEDLSGVQKIDKSLCVEKNASAEFPKKNIFIDPTSGCGEACDGSDQKPYKNLLTALEIEGKLSRSFVQAELNFLLKGEANHDILTETADSTKSYQYFRRDFTSLSIKPAFCEQYSVASCVKKGNKSKIRIYKSIFSLFVANKLRLEQLTIEGAEFCFSNQTCMLNSSQNFTPADGNIGMVNIERIIDENEQSVGQIPLVEIMNCEITNLYSFGYKKGVSQEFGSLINVNNFWGARILIANTNFKGGYLVSGLIKLVSRLPSFYDNIDEVLLKGDSFLQNTKNSVELVNNTFSEYNPLGVVSLATNFQSQSFINCMIKSDTTTFPLASKYILVVNLTQNNFDSFCNGKCFLGKIFDFGEEVSLDSSILLSGNMFSNLNVPMIGNFSMNLSRIDFIDNGFVNSLLGPAFYLKQMNVTFYRSFFKNIHFIRSLLSIERSVLFFNQTNFDAVVPYINEINMLVEIMTFFTISPLSDEFWQARSLNFSREQIIIEGSQFLMSNFTISKDLTNNKLINRIIIRNTTFANLVMGEFDKLLSISVEVVFQVENTLFDKISTDILLFLTYVRNVSFTNTTFSNINGSVFRMESCGGTGLKNFLFCNLTGVQFVNASVRNMKFFEITITKATAYINFVFNDSCIRNISLKSLNSSSSLTNFIISIASSQVTNFVNLTISNIRNIKPFSVEHYENLEFYHSTIYMERVTFTDAAIDIAGPVAMMFSKHRQILFKDCVFSEVINYTILSIRTTLGGISLNNISVFNVSIPVPNYLVILEAKNVTALHINNSEFNGPSLFGGSYLSILTLSKLGRDTLSRFLNESAHVVNKDLNRSIDNLQKRNYLQMPQSFGIFNTKFIYSYSLNIGSVYLQSTSETVFVNCSFNRSHPLSLASCFYSEKNSTTLIKNTTFSSIWGNKGAITLLPYSLFLADNLYFENCSAEKGAYIYAEEADMVISSAIFQGGTADFGGALYLLSAKINLTNSKFIQSTSRKSGGGIYSKSSDILINSCLFLSSVSIEKGGALYLEISKSLVMDNLTLIGCKAGTQGVIAVYGNSFTVNLISNLTCNEGEALQGACIFQEEGNTELQVINLKKMKGKGTILEFLSSFSSINVNITNSLFLNNEMEGLGLKASQANLQLKKINFEKNNIISDYLIGCAYCELLLQDSFFGRNQFNAAFNYSYYMISIEWSEVVIMTNVTFNGTNSVGGIIIKDSNLDINECIFVLLRAFTGGAICSREDSFLKISNSKFVKNKADEAGALYIENSNFSIYSSYFGENAAIGDAADASDIKAKKFKNFDKAMVYISNITIEFSQNSAIVTEHIDIVILLSIKLLNGNVSASASIVAAKNFESLEIEDSSFDLVPSFLLLNEEVDVSGAKIGNTSFRNMTSSNQNGGALLIQGPINITINKSFFIGNIAANNGGAVYTEGCSGLCLIIILNSLFRGNMAGSYGGGFFMENSVNYTFENNIYEKNTASKGINFAGFPEKFLCYKAAATFDEIQSLLSNESSDIDIDEFLIKNALKSFSVSSGQPFDLIIIILDRFNNILNLLNDGVLKIKVDEGMNRSDAALEGDQESVSNGTGILKKIVLMARPKTTVRISIEYKFKQWYIQEFINISILPCFKGEVFTNNLCLPCDTGTFSIYNWDPNQEYNENNSSTSCEICPDKLNCEKRDILLAESGYFRLHDNTSFVTACAISRACPDQLDIYSRETENMKQESVIERLLNYDSIPFPFFQQTCYEGYQGNLCNACKKSYAKNGDGFCIKCSENVMFYIKYCLTLLGSSFFLILQGVLALDFDDVESQKRSILKIIVNHTYFISLLSKFQITWSQEFMEYLEYFDKYITSIPKEIVTLDCFLVDQVSNEEIFFYTYIISIFEPVFIVLFCILLRLITIDLFSFLKRKIQKDMHSSLNLEKYQFFKDATMNMIVLWVVCMYNMYCRFVLKNMKLLKCIKLDNSDRTFLEANPDVECWYSYEHKRLLLSVFFPNILLWCLSWPAFLYFSLRMRDKFIESKRKSLSQGFSPATVMPLEVSTFKATGVRTNQKKASDIYEKEITKNHKIYKLLTMDYRKSCYYWEIFFYATNLLLTSLVVSTSRFDTTSQCGCLISVFLILMLVTESKMPFRFDIMNRLQVISYLVMILSIAILIMTLDNSIPSFQKLIYLIVIILKNILFLGFCALLYVRFFFKTIRESTTKILTKLPTSFKSLRDALTLKSRKSRMKKINEKDIIELSKPTKKTKADLQRYKTRVGQAFSKNSSEV